MKKITIAILTMLTLGAVQADYTLKVPLEQNQGGSLPNGSIIYSGKNNEVSNKQCESYNAIEGLAGLAGASYYWRESRGSHRLEEIKWNGTIYRYYSDVLLYKNIITDTIVHYSPVFSGSIEIEGFRYSRLNNGEPDYNLVWGVCREPI